MSSLLGSEIGITQAHEIAYFILDQFATVDLFQMAAFALLESTVSTSNQ
jgi:hypothetical protein